MEEGEGWCIRITEPVKQEYQFMGENTQPKTTLQASLRLGESFSPATEAVYLHNDRHLPEPMVCGRCVYRGWGGRQSVGVYLDHHCNGSSY